MHMLYSVISVEKTNSFKTYEIMKLTRHGYVLQ